MKKTILQIAKPAANEKGVVLVVVLLLIAVLVLLGSTAVMTTTTDIKISGNYKTSEQAFYDADAGVNTVLARIRQGLVTLPVNNGNTVTVSLSSIRPAGYLFDTSVVLTRVSANRLSFNMTGRAANNASKTITAFLDQPFAPPASTDAALAMYGTGSEVHLKAGGGGGVNLDGRDHAVPTTFDCTGSGCEQPAIAGTGTTGLYTTVLPTITGDTVHMAGNPTATKLGGGVYTEQSWINFANNIINNNLADPGAVGTRDAPKITVVETGVTVAGSAHGAGILIIKDGGSYQISGTATYEGLIILIGSGNVSGTGTGNMYGSMITINHTSKVVDLDGTVDFNYSSAALANLSKIGYSKIRIAAWKEIF